VDALFSNSSVSFSGALAAWIKRIPHVWAVHEILGGKNPQFLSFLGQAALLRLILRLSCLVVVSSSATGEFFGESDKVRLVYSGVKPHTGVSADDGIIRNRFNIAADDVVLGQVGRICDDKGQMEMVQALGMLGTDYPRVKLLLAGRVTDESYLARLRGLIQRENLGERVIFAGFQEDIISFLKVVDCLVVASKMESFGRTIIEAMSVGTPVIAARSGGIPEIITSGENGFLLESRDPEELKRAIVSLVRDRAAFERAAEAGVTTVKEKFQLEHQINGTERVLEECLEHE
jgi:glycosyltransferase involved in cell wall biosynthesis